VALAAGTLVLLAVFGAAVLILGGGSERERAPVFGPDHPAVRHTAAALRSNSAPRLYRVLASAARHGADPTEFARELGAAERRTGPVVTAEFQPPVRAASTPGGRIGTLHLRLGYRGRRVVTYRAYFVYEGGWKLWFTEPARGHA
jgi:hypothetical protein